MIYPKICLSLQIKNKKQFDSIIHLHDFIELRLDFFEDDIDKIINSIPKNKNIIVSLKGDYLDHSKKVKMIKILMDSDINLVDVDIDFYEHFVINKLSMDNNNKLILSHHNYTHSYDFNTLINIYNRINLHEPAFIKIITKPETINDVINIFNLYKHIDNHRLIAFAMGNNYKFTRIASIFLGAPFTYASIDENKKTAEGQYTLSELELLLNNI